MAADGVAMKWKHYLIFALVALAGCDESGKEAVVLDLEEPVRAEVNGTQFDVPLRFFYSEAIEKRGQWPKPSKARVKVDALHLSVLLPDLRGYAPEDIQKWRERGPGDRIEVSVRKPVGLDGWFVVGRERSRADVPLGRAKVLPVTYDLESFDMGWHHVHFPWDGRETMIDCQPAKPGVFPDCRVKSAFRSGLVLEYSFAAQRLERWREIDNGLKALFERFAEGKPQH